MPIETIRHTDTRTNIPTAELRDFVPDDDKSAKVVRYPRDPSLDPQLVWKGKDAQDSQDLEVPSVPIYVQEKVHPKALIDDLRQKGPAPKQEAQLGLFADFNGIQFADLVDFYHHHDKQKWSNRMILGDSLLVMNSLATRENLKGRVQCIYFDPPYGIKFNSNWQVSTRKRDVKDGKAEDATRQPEQVKAFRDTWQLGIHSYLSYLRDRLVVARELLTESGSVFVQIGDENVHLVRNVLDEVFGADNHCGTITVMKTAMTSSDLLANVADYIVWFARDLSAVKYRQLYESKTGVDDAASEYRYLLLPSGDTRPMSASERADPSLVPQGALRFRPTQTTSQRPPGSDPFTFQGKTYRPGSSQYWKTSIDGLTRLGWAGRLIPRGQSISYLRTLDDFPVVAINNVWSDVRWGFDASEKRYVVETNASVVQRCLLMTTDPGDLVLDPTCGSGTTAYVAEQWGRRWITIDTSRVALALARTRLMGAKFPYYLLQDSAEGLAKEADLNGRPVPHVNTRQDIKKGFVCKRVPHVTLKSIANNPDIQPGMTRQEIDAAIARYADVEVLHDQPYEDRKKVRVTGPFTVESLSPHRVLDADLDRPADDVEDEAKGGFLPMILDHLRTAGVQNTKKNERLKFDRLDPYAGVWLHAEGEFTDADGKLRRVAVHVGPEHGTVGEDQVKDAAKEALKGAGFDVLLVLGFAFDAYATEAAKEFQPAQKDGFAAVAWEKQYGKLPIQLVRMNPDLAMGEELLKKSGAANLFLVFGEPDVEVRRRKDGRLEVEVRGVDVYDPTTGQIRSSSTDDIACWFIDTDYNEESFFVRHAYFLGADEPYEKLKKALRAEIDEAAWSELYSAVSRPFERPGKGKIAVKVINHYGDEVLRVVGV